MFLSEPLPTALSCSLFWSLLTANGSVQTKSPLCDSSAEPDRGTRDNQEWGCVCVGGWTPGRIWRAGFGEKGGLQQPPRPVPLHSCHTCATTTSLCLFELSLPISTNKSLCKDEQAWCAQSTHIQARINRFVHNKQAHTPPSWGPHKNPRSTTSLIARENPKRIPPAPFGNQCQ